MKKVDIDLKSSQKILPIDGREHQVLVRWLFDRIRNRIVITEIMCGPERIEISHVQRAALRREIKREYLEGIYRRVATLAGSATLYPGGLPEETGML